MIRLKLYKILHKNTIYSDVFSCLLLYFFSMLLLKTISYKQNLCFNFSIELRKIF